MPSDKHAHTQSPALVSLYKIMYKHLFPYIWSVYLGLNGKHRKEMAESM